MTNIKMALKLAMRYKISINIFYFLFTQKHDSMPGEEEEEGKRKKT
jgi:hypothetical protein